MDRSKRDFLDAIRRGMTPEAAARSRAGYPLSVMHDWREEDTEFADAWDAILPDDDMSDGVVASRILTPGALEAIMWAQVPDDRVAAYFGMTEDVLMARVKENPRLQRIYDTARDGGKAALQMAQFDAALAGDKGMQTWLGKQYLEQADKVETKIEMPGQGSPVTINNIILRSFTTEQLEMMQAQALGIGQELVIEGTAERVHEPDTSPADIG
jgi:hypothetical protein